MNLGNGISEEHMKEKIAQITASILEMGPDHLDKSAVVQLLQDVEALKKEARAKGASSMLRLAEWWDKLLTASLLDAVRCEKELYCLLCFFADRARFVLDGTAEENTGGYLDSRDLIVRAASLLGEPVPSFEDAPPQQAAPDARAQLSQAPSEPAEREEPSPAAGAIREGQDGAAETESAIAVGSAAGTGLEGGEMFPASPGAGNGCRPEKLDFEGTLFDESLIYEFIDECESHLEDIESKILALEENPEDRAVVDEVFRPVHSIKGGAGFLGVKVMQDFAHKAENLLDEARKGKLPITSALVETLLEVVDILKTMLSQLRSEANRKLGKDASKAEFPPVPVQRTLSHIDSVLAGRDPEDSHREKPAPGNSGQPEAMGKLGEILVAEGTLSEAQLDHALNLQERRLGKILVEEGMVSEEKVEEALKVQQGAGKQQSAAIKVDIEKLDELMNHVGELVIAQTLVRGSSLLRNVDPTGQAFGKDVAQLGKITKEIQDRVMSLRMVPLRPVFQKMTRLVRDVSRKSGKQVQLILTGEDTEVDKTVSETISDPLVHILRNSVDHGVESPEVRIAQGKDASGKVRLSAYHQGGNIVIEIADDGKGLDRERILRKAVERGLAEPGVKLTDAQIFQFVMMPGFSTAEKITDISGRGVGMDVVRKNIERLRGKVEIASAEGKGTTVTIKLPLTLAIIDGMVVRVGCENFIFPTLSIVRSFRPEPNQISTVRGRGEMVNVRWRLLPMVRLHQLYGIAAEPAESAGGLCVIVENEGGNYALLVDELLGQQQVVIKNLGVMFKNIKGIAGGTIMGDGHVGLILDMAGVYEAYHDLEYGGATFPPGGETVLSGFEAASAVS